MVYDDGFSDWFTGFIDGEGCFLTNVVSGRYVVPLFHVTLRGDDRAILELCRQRFGGGVYDVKRLPYTHNNRAVLGRPAVHWRISKRSQLMGIVQHFDAHPLRSKKARDFLVWRKLVLGYLVPYGARDLRSMWSWRNDLREVRRWQDEIA